MTLPLQIRELRKRREWTQPQLAEKAGMGQPRISELEKPGERRLTIEALLRLASAFDIGLQVRFVPFGELIDWSEGLDIDTFDVQAFEVELAEAERRAILEIPRRPPVGTTNRRQSAACRQWIKYGTRNGNVPPSELEGGQNGTESRLARTCAGFF